MKICPHYGEVVAKREIDRTLDEVNMLGNIMIG